MREGERERHQEEEREWSKLEPTLIQFHKMSPLKTVYLYVYLNYWSELHILAILYNKSDRCNGNCVWEMRAENSLLYIKKKNNKLFGWLHALNTHICVIFSPAQCCWCRSGCQWHAENVLHSFLHELVSESLGGFLILLHQNRTRFPCINYNDVLA